MNYGPQRQRAYIQPIQFAMNESNGMHSTEMNPFLRASDKILRKKSRRQGNALYLQT